MRRAAVALLALAVATAALALDVPPPPQQWLNDYAGLLPAPDASALNEKLRAFESRSGVQFLIAVFPSLDGEAMEAFTIRCAEKWKVGNKKYDNGLILFVFVKERKLRFEVGYGLEPTITDAFASDVIRNDVAPHFKSGDYAGGLNAAVDHVIARIEKTETPTEAVSPGARGSYSRSSRGGGISPKIVLLILFALFFFVLPALRRGRRGGGCGGCFWPLFLLNSGGSTFGSGGGGWGGGGGGGGFSGGGGSFGGGGASGGW